MFENENGPFPSGVGDPEGRELDVVRRDAELASRACQLIDEAIALGRRRVLGREGGAKQFVRLERSRDVFA